jgi:hypothetical protein
MGNSISIPINGEATHVAMVQLCSLLSQISLDNLSRQLWYQAGTSKLKYTADNQRSSLFVSLRGGAKVFSNV